MASDAASAEGEAGAGVEVVGVGVEGAEVAAGFRGGGGVWNASAEMEKGKKEGSEWE